MSWVRVPPLPDLLEPAAADTPGIEFTAMPLEAVAAQPTHDLTWEVFLQ
jgi:hypothetical protein